MTLIVYHKGQLVADSCNIVNLGHTDTVYIGDKIVILDDMAFGVTGETNPDGANAMDRQRLFRTILIAHSVKHWEGIDKISEEEQETLRAWCVYLAAAAYQYLNKIMGDTAVICMSRHAALYIGGGEMHFRMPDEMHPLLVGSGATYAATAFAANLSTQKVFELTCKLDHLIKPPFKTVRQQDLETISPEEYLMTNVHLAKLGLELPLDKFQRNILPIFEKYMAAKAASQES